MIESTSQPHRRPGAHSVVLGILAVGLLVCISVWLAIVPDAGDPPDALSSIPPRPDQPARGGEGVQSPDPAGAESGETFSQAEARPPEAQPRGSAEAREQTVAATAPRTDAERRALAADSGYAAAATATPNEIAMLNGSLPAFFERAAFVQSLSQAFPVARLEDVEAVAQAIADPKLQQLFLRRFGQRIATADFEAAVDWVMNLSAGPAADAAWAGVVAGWGESEPEVMLEWAVANDQPAVAEIATGKIARTLASSDPRAAAELANGLVPSRARTQALSYALTLWAAQDHEAVIEWAGNHPDFATRSLALIATAKAWGQTDPEAASAWIASWNAPALIRIKELAMVQVPVTDRSAVNP